MKARSSPTLTRLELRNLDAVNANLRREYKHLVFCGDDSLAAQTPSGLFLALLENLEVELERVEHTLSEVEDLLESPSEHEPDCEDFVSFDSWEVDCVNRSISDASDTFFLTSKAVGLVTSAVNDCDALFFERIAVMLTAKKNDLPQHSLTARDLKLKRNRGRKPKPWDLAKTAPLAAIEVTNKRVRQAPDKQRPELNKISRKEFTDAIIEQQAKKGLVNPTAISDTELSRWINHLKIHPFMMPAQKSAQ